MATSAELKALIVAKIDNEWGDPKKGADWKDGENLTLELFHKLTDPKNWKRAFKGRQKIGETTFVMRQFFFESGSEREGVLEATVTCDENDNFLEGGIEFEQQ